MPAWRRLRKPAYPTNPPRMIQRKRRA